ncbi:TPA: hypothetical protein MYN30_001012, partial [Klebsiella variicola subsp. variicola]|nr:hypothetical protein [Klebsiella variicola subsp. variicola]
MANTDTSNAKQYATQAQVAAAQAKIYADQSQEASGFADAAQESADQSATSAASAADSAAAASTSASSSAISAADSAASANSASTSALTAAEFGDNKLTFADTATGIAGTINGQYFRVPQGVGNVLAFRYYKNNAGVAQEVAEYPGQGSITNSIRQYATLATAQSDVSAGNVLNGSYCWVRNSSDITLADEYINNAGTLSPTGRKVNSALPTGYQSATTVSSSAANAVAITIPGLLVDGSLIYFLSPILNTSSVNVTVTDAKGNSVTRAVQKQNNAPLVGSELLLNQPVLMEFRTGTANNFILVASGPSGADLASRISTLELNSVALLSG